MKIRPTSKIALKMTCLEAVNGDVKKAQEMYDFFASDIDLPDYDHVPPTQMQQFKQTASSMFGWVKENKDDLMQAFAFVQNLRSGGGFSSPVNIPPLPEE